MSTSTSATPTSAGASTLSSDLFPTSTQSSTSVDSEGKRGTNVYYLVFLGVLIILLLLAGCLAFRAFRIRRRYRTATQLAIARGGPLPDDLRNDYWGLGGLTGWTAEGLDRMGIPISQDVEHGRRLGKVRWQKIPKMWEGSVEEKDTVAAGGGRGGGGDSLELAQPVMVYSLRPEETSEGLSGPLFPYANTHDPAHQPSSSRSFSPMAFYHRRRRPSVAEESVSPAPPAPVYVKEQDREMDDEEPLRVAILIQMPVEEDPRRKDKRSINSSSSIDEDGTGWETGMELGVWEGAIRTS